jgi:hypothetical protein
MKPPGPIDTMRGSAGLTAGLALAAGFGCEGATGAARTGAGRGAGGAALTAGRGASRGGAGRGGAAGRGVAGASLAFTGDGRDLSPRRCALPMTALRLTPPSSSAIWLAVKPFSQRFRSVSIRSSVHDMQKFPVTDRQCRSGQCSLRSESEADRPKIDAQPARNHQ